MKKLCILTLIFSVQFPVLNIFAACDNLAATMDAAQASVESAKRNLKDLNSQSFLKWAKQVGKAFGAEKDFDDSMANDPNDLADKLEEAHSQLSLDNQIKAAEETLAAAESAYSTAYYNFMVCYQNHLQEEITGACGYTYKRLHRSDHEWTYFACGHAGYPCQPGIHYLTYCSKCDTLYYFCEDEGHMYTCSGSGSSSGSDCQ